MRSEKKKILFLAPYPKGFAPSQRFRFEQYFSLLQNHFQYNFESFWSQRAWENLYERGNVLLKIYYLIAGFIKRFLRLFALSKYDFIFIHRELSPVGPPVFEFIIINILRKKVIYDFDDAIWLVKKSGINRFASLIKNPGKTNWICKWSQKVSVGNEFLADHARQFNDKVTINPTIVDTDQYHNEIKTHTQKERVSIGWTGTHSTLPYLHNILPILDKLYREIPFELILVCNDEPTWKRKYLHFIKWKKEKEVEQLLRFDIGIMPLENTQWEHGKCGFKIIQYLSLGIPAIASPVGVNKQIIQHGKSGFLANSENEWINHLSQLMQDVTRRKEFGQKGRQFIVDHFSVQANFDHFLLLFAK